MHVKRVDPFVCIREEAPKYNKHLPLYVLSNSLIYTLATGQPTRARF